MVEKDPGTSGEMMTLSIVHGHPMRVGLGDAVGAPWVEGSAFVLGYLNGLSVHLAAGAADHPDDLVPLLQEELSEVRSVLSGDPGHRRPFHRLSTQLNRLSPPLSNRS